MNTAVSEQRGTGVLEASALEAAQRATGGVEREAGRRKVAWWLWPHVMSLDAPIVAVVWQHWWARAAGGRIPWFADAILALGVWMIYLADRLADTRPSSAEPPATTRHAFSARHRRVLQPLLAGVVAALVFLTPMEMTRRQFIAGLGLLLVASGYFWLIHRGRPSRWSGWATKEAFVGVIFAFGTTFFVGWQPGALRWPVLGAMVLFAALCFCNCALITQWEANPEDRASLRNAVPRLDSHLGPGCLWLAALAGVLAAGSGSTVCLPILFSALGLAWLDHRRAVYSPDVLRVVADLALLAPLLCGG